MTKYHLFIKLGMAVCVACLFCQQSLHAQFIEISKDAGINYVCEDPTQLSGGVAFFDFNNDGFEDIYIIGGSAPDKLYENQGNGTFRDVSKIVGIDVIDDAKTMGVSCGDFDNDGYSDLFITTKNNDRSYLFWNMEGTFFSEGGIEAGISASFYGSSIALGDYDMDGRLDMYVGNYNSGSPGDFLFRNNGDRTFTDQSYLLEAQNQGMALAVAFSDVDMDHDVDILLGNDFGYLYQPNRLFMNEFPETSFAEISQQASWDIKINSMGIAIGDYDEDGDLDYYISDMGDNFLFVNQGDRSFLERAYETGIDNADGTSWGNAFFDYDNNTYLDLFVSNGVFEINPIEEQNRLFKGNGSTFADVSNQQEVASSFRSRGLAVGDYNNDGQLDILVGVVANPGTDSHTLLYQNPGSDDNWVKLKLHGISSNKDAYGSLIRVVSEGRSFIRELSGGGSYLSHNSNSFHFGLGSFSNIDSLIVSWPNAEDQIFEDLEVNTTYFIVEDQEIFKTRSVYQVISPDEEIFLAGEFRNTAGIYTDTLSVGTGLREIIITRLAIDGSVTSINYEATNEARIKIWPNPFEGNVRISLENTYPHLNEVKLSILDRTARVVFEGKIGLSTAGTIEIDHLKSLPAGLYLFRLTYNGKIYSQKLIKQ